MRTLCRVAVAAVLLSASVQGQAGCDPVTGSNWLIPYTLVWTANHSGAGDNYSLEWDGCDSKSFCFVPKTASPPMWGGTDLSGWKISAKIASEMVEDGGQADPDAKTIYIASEVIDGLNADPSQVIVIITHEMYHVAIADLFPEFDSLYGVCNCPVECAAGATKESHPWCYPCTWLNEQVASCTAAQALCCSIGDPDLTQEERDTLMDAIDLAKMQCETALDIAPFGHSGCPVSPKPMAPMNAPDECPPAVCPTPAMVELGDS